MTDIYQHHYSEIIRKSKESLLLSQKVRCEAEKMNDDFEKHLEELQKMLKDVKYGSIVITVQDGEIVQIDKTEKYRVRN